jgi:Mn2+/Fe2+ NRAMP family transporter
MGIHVASGDKGMVQLGDILEKRFGVVLKTVFMIGFWATSMTSLLGVWNGVSLMFSDFVRDVQNKPEVTGEASTRTPQFRAYLLWLTFPPMGLIFVLSGSPVKLVLVYSVLGAIFMPFLAGTLLWLLNRRVAKEYRNGWLSNAMLVVSLLLFGFLCVTDVVTNLAKFSK